MAAGGRCLAEAPENRAAGAPPGIAASEAGEGLTTGERALRSDKRLRARVSVAEQDRPLAGVVRELSTRLAVPLVAARDVADDRATLIVDDRPAVEVLIRLARHFGFQWRRRRDGYELTQDIASRQREEALRDAEVSEQLAEIREQMEQAARISAQPAERLHQRAEEIGEQLGSGRLTPTERWRLIPPPWPRSSSRSSSA